MNIAIILLIVGAILIIMAMIGYMAEKKGFGKKKENKEKVEGQIPEVVNQDNLTTPNIPVETWSEDAKPKDEHQETIHKVPTVDDWSSIPTGDDLPEVKLENPNVEETETNNVQDNEPMFPEIKPTDLEVPGIETPTIENTQVETLTNEQPAPTPAEDTPILEEPVSEPQNIDYSFDFSNQVTEEPVVEETPVETLAPETPIVDSVIEPVGTIEPAPMAIENISENVIPETEQTTLTEPQVETLTTEPVMPEVVPVQTPVENVTPIEPVIETPQPTVGPVANETQPAPEPIIAPQPASTVSEPIEEMAKIETPSQETQTETSIWN